RGHPAAVVVGAGGAVHRVVVGSHHHDLAPAGAARDLGLHVLAGPALPAVPLPPAPRPGCRERPRYRVGGGREPGGRWQAAIAEVAGELLHVAVERGLELALVVGVRIEPAPRASRRPGVANGATGATGATGAKIRWRPHLEGHGGSVPRGSGPVARSG